MNNSVIFTQDGDVLNFDIPSGNVNVADLSAIVDTVPNITGQRVIISGRGPVWLFGAIALKLKNNVATVATFDPKIGGGIVIHSINPNTPIGSVIPFAQPVAA